MRRVALRVGACALAVFLSCCTHTSTQISQTATISWTEPSKRVVLIEPDVKLGELEASGMIDWRSDWSQTAKGFIQADVRQSLLGHNVEVVESGNLSDPHAIQLVKLHTVVGNAITIHAIMGGAYKLPTKSDPLDFTLGPGTSVLRDKYNADYALFVTVRDSYSTSGRMLLMLGAAALGVGVSGGQQAGFASLVDLRTGNVVWFNRITSQSGDLRTQGPAHDVVANLITKLPL